MVEPAPKSRKRRIATKSPKHQPSQNNVYQYIKIGKFWCFRGLVAKKSVFGVDS
jgi:hypothetical protein